MPAPPERSRIVCLLAATLAAFCATAVPALAQGTAAPAAAAPPDAEVAHVTAPVVVDGESLFRVRGTAAYPAEQRARAIEGRILDAAQTRSIAPETVRAEPRDEGINITAGDRFLMTVTDADGRVEDLEKDLLARTYVDRIQRAIRAYREAREPSVVLRGARQAVAATVALLLVLLGVWWAFRRLNAWFGRKYQERIRSLEFQSFEILRAQRIRAVYRAVVGTVRAVVTLVAIYLWLQFVLSSFPVTRPLSTRLLSFVVEPVSRLGAGLLAHLPDLAVLLVLFLVTRWTLRLAHAFFDALAHRRVTLANFEPEWAAPTYRILRLLVVMFALVVAYPYIPGSRSAAFQGISIFLGVMFSLGSSSFISNIIAGYSMTYRRAFRLGDRIQVEDKLGDVTEIRLQVTHLRSVKNEEIIVPNSTLLNSTVVNYTALARTRGLILHTTVGIGYETPWRQVEAMLLLAAERTEGLMREPPPFVLQKSLGDFCVVYEINVYCDQPVQMAVLYTRLHQQILDVFNEYGVQIMTPAYEGDPEQRKVVPRDQWWTAPARPVAAEPKPAKGTASP